jgi:hypothetical protein
MANRIHPVVQPVQMSGRNPPPDRAVIEPQEAQLRDRDDSVLPRRQLGQLLPNRRWAI